MLMHNGRLSDPLDEITKELKRIISMVGAADPGSVTREALVED